MNNSGEVFAQFASQIIINPGASFIFDDLGARFSCSQLKSRSINPMLLTLFVSSPENIYALPSQVTFLPSGIISSAFQTTGLVQAVQSVVPETEQASISHFVSGQ